MDVTEIFRLLILIFGIYSVLVTSEDEQAITNEECTNAANFTTVKSLCCLRLEFTDKPARDCLQWIKKYPDPESDNLNDHYIYASTLTECICMKRNFIESHSRLNMTAVKDYAEWYYPNQPEGQNFIIDMYTICSQNATNILTSVSEHVKGKEYLKGTHEPYFMFVLMCAYQYPNFKCPYYTWRGEGSNRKLCERYAHQCRERYLKNTSTTDVK